ncbi:MAG: hypothetical protein ACLUN9_16880 [Enterocloster aldenensis]|nr:hypothetical protein [Clostridiales bacterium]MBS6853788.1 hypothetical protein [Clostridiales bacterium]MCB7337414.1 hypothetical protein [Enterocloster aldenensis]
MDWPMLKTPMPVICTQDAGTGRQGQAAGQAAGTAGRRIEGGLYEDTGIG